MILVFEIFYHVNIVRLCKVRKKSKRMMRMKTIDEIKVSYFSFVDASKDFQCPDCRCHHQTLGIDEYGLMDHLIPGGGKYNSKLKKRQCYVAHYLV